MGFFDDDPFESIVREFFQEARPRTSSGNMVQGESEERKVDYIDEGNRIYFVFELYGYSKEDIKVNVGKGFVEVEAKKKNFEGIQDYIARKLEKGVKIKKEVPGLKAKDSHWTFNNGILEVEIEEK